VYILEAHAEDEWPIGAEIQINQAKTQEDRLAAAHRFIREAKWGLPVVADTMANEFEHHYAAWPTRYYVVDHVEGVPTLVYKAHEDDDPEGEVEETTCRNDIGELNHFVERYIASRPRDGKRQRQ